MENKQHSLQQAAENLVAAMNEEAASLKPKAQVLLQMLSSATSPVPPSGSMLSALREKTKSKTD